MITGHICLECKGTGRTCFIVNEEEKTAERYIPIFDFIPCEHCNSKGYIEYGEWGEPEDVAVLKNEIAFLTNQTEILYKEVDSLREKLADLESEVDSQ